MTRQILISLLAAGAALLAVALLASCRENQLTPNSEAFDQLDISPDGWQARGQTFRFASHNTFRNCHSERIDEVIHRTKADQRRIFCWPSRRFFAGPVA